MSGRPAAWLVLALLAHEATNAWAQRPALTLEWLGQEADRYHGDDVARPDGRTDLHFRLTIRLTRPTLVRSITLQPVGESDEPIGGLVYGTADSGDVLLVVERNGDPLHPGFTASLGVVEPGTVLDLYTLDNGTIDTGTRVLVEIERAEGPPIRRAVTLAPPAGRLLGIWNVHCDSRDPNAFEPMTLSGRLRIDLGPGDRLAGIVDGIPLSGAVVGDSLHAAGESSSGRAALRGKLSRPRGRGARPRAEGWIDIQPVGLSCREGPWWTE